MAEQSVPQVTQLLRAWSAGDEGALARLMPMIYSELRRMARRRVALEKPDISLQPTALVNEAYLRLAEANGIDLQDRGQFFALAAKVMRGVLVDAARAKAANKRGGGAEKIPVEDALFAARPPDRDIVIVDDALEALAKQDPRKARVVEMRFFGGFSIEETAEALNISVQTVRRDWNFSQAWLAKEIHHRTGSAK